MEEIDLDKIDVENFAKDHKLQEAVYSELGTYEKLQELHLALEKANQKIGELQYLYDRLAGLTEETLPLKIIQKVREWRN